MVSVLPKDVVKSLMRELLDMQTSPCEGIRVIINEQDITDVQAEIQGPADTPFEGGLFRMKLCLPSDFPASPPKGFFLTKIWHPNVSKAGEICVNVLKRDWKPDLGIKHVLLVIRCLLIEPFPESALNEEAGMALLENYEEYFKYAKLMTGLHAKPIQATPLTTSGANATSSKADIASQPDGSPLKKARPEHKQPTEKAMKAKKSLRRL